MKDQPNVALTVAALIIAGAFVFVSLQAMGRVDRYLKNQAVYQCAQRASVTYTNADGASVTEPYKPAYEACLQIKGY